LINARVRFFEQRKRRMKVKTLKRTLGSVERECPGDLRREARNLNPKFHPMQKAREYTRAVTAAKMDRMFAAPLVGNLGNGHADSVTCTSLSRRSLLPLVSGSADGQVMLWDLASRTMMAALKAHARVVTGVVFALSGDHFYSCSDDGSVHQWSIQQSTSASNHSFDGNAKPPAPRATWRTAGSFKSIDHNWFDPQFATASDEAVQIWTPERSASLQVHGSLWGSSDTVAVVRYNPAERSLLACCTADRGIGLLDTRTGTALRKTVLRMRSNDLQWNPMEPMNFCVASDDHHAYVFDMRQLSEPMKIYKGHTSAVLALAWSPTGREFATGSYDKTVRIFKTTGGTSRDIYHTKRMQRVTTVQYTQDGKFLVTGSDDSNLRLWKSHASDPVGLQLTPREEAAMRYRSALIHKHQHLPEVKRIHRSRKVPKLIRKQTQQSLIMKDAEDRKQANRVKYSKKGEHQFVAERKRIVVKQVE
jgi:WD repeat and SOF domain-containing protein 1